MDAQEALQGLEDLVTIEEFPISDTGPLVMFRRADDCGWESGGTEQVCRAKAAAAASPPMMTVCKPLRTAPAPVTRPLTAPKRSRANRVIPTDAGSAV